MCCPVSVADNVMLTAIKAKTISNIAALLATPMAAKDKTVITKIQAKRVGVTLADIAGVTPLWDKELTVAISTAFKLADIAKKNFKPGVALVYQPLDYDMFERKRVDDHLQGATATAGVAATWTAAAGVAAI